MWWTPVSSDNSDSSLASLEGTALRDWRLLLAGCADSAVGLRLTGMPRDCSNASAVLTGIGWMVLGACGPELAFEFFVLFLFVV